MTCVPVNFDRLAIVFEMGRVGCGFFAALSDPVSCVWPVPCVCEYAVVLSVGCT